MATVKEITEDPRFTSLTPAQKQRIISMADDYQNFPKAAMAALENVTVKPLREAKRIATDPVRMAEVLPEAAGIAGALSPVPGGATIGTVAGRQISNFALERLGRPDLVPSNARQVGEAGLSVAGDVIAIPGIKKALLGPQIGSAEKAAGVITQAPRRLPTSGNVGEVLQDLEETLLSGKMIGPQSARDAYAVAKYVIKNPNLVGKADEIAVQAARVKKLAQEQLNREIPSRAGPAKEMAQAMKIPNAIGRAYEKIPKPIRQGLGIGVGIGAGAGGAGTLAFELGKKVFGK